MIDEGEVCGECGKPLDGNLCVDCQLEKCESCDCMDDITCPECGGCQSCHERTDCDCTEVFENEDD